VKELAPEVYTTEFDLMTTERQAANAQEKVEKQMHALLDEGGVGDAVVPVTGVNLLNPSAVVARYLGALVSTNYRKVIRVIWVCEGP
jgi:hypothetical protein